MIGSEMIDIQDSHTPQDSQFKYYYDGALCPQYNEFEFESIEREGSIPLSTEGKDFTPVLYLHNNTYLVSSFQKRDTSMSPSQILYGFKIFWVADDPKSFGGSKANLVYSSDALFMSTSKINHITVIERESDGINLICVNREDGYIYILNYFINDDNEFLMELDNTIVPQTYEGQITSLRRLGGSDFLVCTNTRGEILTFDTVRCEMISAEKSKFN